MTDKLKKQIDECLECLQANGYKKGKNWNDYEVLEPVIPANVGFFIGMPLVILIKDEKARISTAEESLNYLDFAHHEEDDDDEDDEETEGTYRQNTPYKDIK